MSGSLLALVAMARAADGAASAYTLVGLYDATALSLATGGSPSTWVWSPSPGLLSSCGAPKAPVGLGMFEAEAMTDRVSPVLAVVLRREGGAPLEATSAAGADDLRLALGDGTPSVLLQPAVLPRRLQVQVTGDPNIPPAVAPGLLQLVRTQIEMELCLEHKVGRAWIGGKTEEIRQAFLLDPPDGPPDRMFFGGQGTPVPALLGPPAACLVRAGGGTIPERGPSAAGLVPSDVWGAALPACDPEGLREPSLAPLLGTDGTALPPDAGAPQRLDVSISGAGRESAQVELRLSNAAGGDTLLFSGPLFSGAGVDEGMVDLLAQVPLSYPEIAGRDGSRYVVLLVPDWQLVEGLRRLDAGTPAAALGSAPGRLGGGVTAVLANPDRLFIQARGGQAGGDEAGGEEAGGEPARGGEARGEGDTWLDLGATLGRGPVDPRAWGYPAGGEGARTPAFTFGDTPAPSEAVGVAQRSGWQAAMIVSVTMVLGVLLAGFSRLRDLWTRLPEERIDFWPGEVLAKAEEPDAPDPRDVVAE